VRLFCKGADSVILERIESGQPMLSSVLNHLVRVQKLGRSDGRVGHTRKGDPACVCAA